jgi:hypothetical protein
LGNPPSRLESIQQSMITTAHVAHAKQVPASLLTECEGTGANPSYVPQLGWTAAAAFPATPAAWFYSELSWWRLQSSLPLHVAHMHCGSRYSVKSLYQPSLVRAVAAFKICPS